MTYDKIRDWLWHFLTYSRPPSERLNDGIWKMWPDGREKRFFQKMGYWIDRAFVVFIIGFAIPTCFVLGAYVTGLRFAS